MSVSRLRTADSFAGLNSSGTALQHYAYSYDLAGNRTQAVAPAGTSNFTYDSANHLLTSQLGAGPVVNYTYDHAGRLTNDGTNTYTWDGANRLLSLGSTSYLYNGTGQRMQQTVGSTVTQYVLDTQPGLAKVLQATTGSNVTRYVHGPMGIQEQQNPDATWRHPIQDGLGSVRTVVDATNTPQESRFYDPYGNEVQQSGSQQTTFGFTGEETDANGLVNLRARYYNPATGQFVSLDLLEGDISLPTSLNRYMYVQGNPINLIDPTGLIYERPDRWLSCINQFSSPGNNDYKFVSYDNSSTNSAAGCNCDLYQTDSWVYLSCIANCSTNSTPTLGPIANNTPRAPLGPPSTNTPRAPIVPPSTSTPTPTPPATNATGTPCRHANGYFFNVFGQSIDQRPALLGQGDYLDNPNNATHHAVDLAPIGAFTPGTNQLKSDSWAGQNVDMASVYAVVNGTLSPYAEGLFLQNTADPTKYFQYEHVVYLAFTKPFCVCAGDFIGWVGSIVGKEGNQDHIHFGYRNSTGVSSSLTFYDPRPFFYPSILMTRTDITRYYTTTPTPNPSTPTPGSTYRPTPTPTFT